MSLTAYADADHAGCQDSRRRTSGSASFLGDNWFWSSKSKDHSSKTTDLTSIKFLYTVIIKVQLLFANTMAEQNVPAQAPTNNKQISTSSAMVTNREKQSSFRCSKDTEEPYLLDIFDEQWFNLSADLFRKALDITPVDPAHPFELPPTGDTVIDFVNQLGYPEPVEFVSNIRVNYVYQPWRAILTLINQCLTRKTSGIDKPRHPVLQMLWGIVTRTNVDHAELLWEEFTQGIQTFFSHKASHKASLKDPKKKAVPLLIPYGRFTKMIIYYLGSTSDVHKRPESPCHLPGDDFPARECCGPGV
ncbi:hypothetical protein Tco_0011829 [Tanacetum coccineum]